MKIILASASKQRAKLLSKIITNFEIRPAEIEEKIKQNESTITTTKHLAQKKARTVFRKSEIILGFDTLGELNGWTFGKPRNKKEAIIFLQRLSGKTHTVVSSFCVKTNTRETIGHTVAFVTFRKLDDVEIEKYVSKNPVESFAGGYAIQGEAKNFVEKLKGKIDTVIGFPTHQIRIELIRNAAVQVK